MIKIEFISPRQLWLLIKDSALEFIEDRGIKLSAALAYYTIFSIPPLLIIIISIAGSVFGEQAIEGHIFGQIKGIVGAQTAAQIQETIGQTVIDRNTIWATIISIAALLLGATGVFVEIQDSINLIWGLKTKPKKGLIKLVINRLISFSMIVSIGFLLLVSLIINALLDVFNAQLHKFFPETAYYAFYIFNILFMLLVITVLFGTIFKVLPDAKIKWKSVFFGSLFTALLFLLGKVLIGLYLGKSDIGTTYGAAGSIVLMLVWVYYSSIILFYGAEFTQLYALRFGSPIEPNNYAIFVAKHETEVEDQADAKTKVIS